MVLRSNKKSARGKSPHAGRGGAAHAARDAHEDERAQQWHHGHHRLRRVQLHERHENGGGVDKEQDNLNGLVISKEKTGEMQVLV